MQITIKQKDLKAVAYAMPAKDIRYYLCGILIESNGQETRLIGCDGHRLHAVVVTDSTAELVDPVDVIVPAAFVKALLKAKFPKGYRKEFAATIEGGSIKVNLPDDTQATCKTIDGKFPDYQRGIPAECSGEYALLNPYYALAAKVAWGAYMEGDPINSPDFAYNGGLAAMIACDGFVAVVMARRETHEVITKPDARFKADLAKPAKEEIAA